MAAVTEGMEMGWDMTKDWTLNPSPGRSELHDSGGLGAASQQRALQRP